MRFALIDMDGSTLDTFDDASSAIACLQEMLIDDPTAADEIGVIEYRDGQRLRSPMLATEFITWSRIERMQAFIGRGLENVRIDLAAALNATNGDPSRAWIEIAISSVKAESLDTVLRDPQSHQFSLAV